MKKKTIGGGKKREGGEGKGERGGGTSFTNATLPSAF